MAGTDAIVEQILTTYDTITVVGASAAPVKAAHYVPAHMQQFGWRIIPVNLREREILGEPAYRTLADVPEQVGLVDVFRPSRATPDIAPGGSGRRHRAVAAARHRLGRITGHRRRGGPALCRGPLPDHRAAPPRPARARPLTAPS